MAWLPWFNDNWFTALQSLAIASGFVFTCVTLQRDERSRRAANVFQLTANHHEIWKQMIDQPELWRIMSADVDLERNPVTDNETLFVSFLVLHLNSAYQAIKQGVMEMPEGLGSDISAFFVHPIPRAVWGKLRSLQNRDFVAFVEEHFDNEIAERSPEKRG